ncbi:hypothetical protein DFH11DRAFT_1267837 [Phellopilus nigrolimitatus]|nr:hypothetical protein DFH11DRAFT_1267837 [Phellopilus nigrolimitatus]
MCSMSMLRRATCTSLQSLSPEPEVEQEQEYERTLSKQGTSVASDHTDVTKAVDGESTTTAPFLFGDDFGGTPQLDAEADFFSTMGTTRNTIPDHVLRAHQNYSHNSSVAATVGSRPSSSAL